MTRAHAVMDGETVLATTRLRDASGRTNRTRCWVVVQASKLWEMSDMVTVLENWKRDSADTAA